MKHLWMLLISCALVSGAFVADLQQACGVGAWAEPTAAPTQAQAEPTAIPDDQVNRVARQLYCPICENTPLDACETLACQDWKDEIRRRLAAGQSEQEIVDYFADLYGERALARPRSWVVWALPLLGLALALAVFAFLSYQWSQRHAPAAFAPAPPPNLSAGDAAYVERLEQELEEF